jgi:dipeptidyl aminopeptidase/acylaminoacyl peptidase
VNIETMETERLFHSEAPRFSMPSEILDEEGTEILVRHESVDTPPNYFVRNLATGEERPVTTFEHPTPQLVGVQKEQIRYERADGVMLTGTLYLPAGYDAEQDGPLPVLMWAYPQEYKSADAAGQVTDSPYRFVRVGWWSPLIYLLSGYAVLDDPAMPVIGEGDEEPNDTFIEQLVSSAQAAADEMVRRGVGEYGRMAVGGHSYGAFMTANLLAHSEIFAAGIARSGAYNRTLTPFGFQAEERDFWEAPEIYFAMSPFMHAPKVNEPILLIHGEADNNSGTYPMQSERYYAALKGNGATARLVMLPYESHGYRSRESILHIAAEQEKWLDTFVKGEPLPDGLERASAPQSER